MFYCQQLIREKCAKKTLQASTWNTEKKPIRILRCLGTFIHLQFKMTLSNKWERLFLSSALVRRFFFSLSFFFFLFDLTNSTTLYCIFLFFSIRSGWEKTHPATNDKGGQDTQYIQPQALLNATPGSSRMSGTFQNGVAGGRRRRRRRQLKEREKEKKIK
jgi:hypothetical protein